MTDMNIELRWRTEDGSLIDQISDEALEAAADMTNQAAYTLGACTGLSACPRERRKAPPMGVIRLVRAGGDEPAHVPDAVIDTTRARERDGAIDTRAKGRPGSAIACKSWPDCLPAVSAFAQGHAAAAGGEAAPQRHRVGVT